MSDDRALTIKSATIHVEQSGLLLQPKCVSVKQTAEMLSLSEDVIRDLVARGQLRSIRVGSRVVIPVQSIDEWISDQLAGGDVEWPGRSTPKSGATGRVQSIGAGRRGRG